MRTRENLSRTSRESLQEKGESVGRDGANGGATNLREGDRGERGDGETYAEAGERPGDDHDYASGCRQHVAWLMRERGAGKRRHNTPLTGMALKVE